ncbi:MAG: hypothetical protein ABEI78_00785 [Candidatus Nanohaloarchaea archaeon]
MSYEKLAKGMSQEKAKRKLERVMPVQQQKTEFQGASPPSVFIGSNNYPKVNTGILSPQHPGDSSLLDSPDKWYQQDYKIEKIASLRTSLVNSKKEQRVEEPENFINNTREIAMAEKPVDIEVSLEKRPRNNLAGGRVKPVSASGDIQQFKLGENPSVNRQVEKAYYDTDAKAENIMEELWEKGVNIYKLQQSLSTGMLGQEENRKLVPTRWSITASDDIASKKIRSRVKTNQEIGEIKYFTNEYVGNKFHIFLLPGRWEYELLEMKRPGSVWNAAENTYIAENYEPFAGRTEYAEETAGAFYATRLGILEYLDSINRQAKALVLRDVSSNYWAPLGVWVIRETVRNALEGEQNFDSFEDVKMKIGHEFKFLYKRIKKKSKILTGRQTDLSQFQTNL